MTEQDNKGVTVLSEDNGEISDAQRREINEAVSWLNNWIEKRHQRGFMSDAEYEKAHKKLQNLIVATKDEAYDFAGGMRASGYFSITDDNEKITINRKEYPVDNVIHVSRNADNLGSRVVHEATHALRLEDSEKACTPEKVQSYYMDDKREIYARVMETRYNFNLDPQAKLSKENLRYLRETELGPEALAREKEQAERDREFDAMLRELTGETPLPEAQAEEKENVSPVKPQTTGSRRSEQKTFILDSYSEDEKLKFFNDTADNGRANEGMNGLHAAMAANHSAISERIAAFRARRNSESVQRANLVAGMRADNLRLQQKRQELAEMTGSSPVTPYPHFADRHYRCEDTAAEEAVRRRQAAEAERASPSLDADKPTVSKSSALRKFMNFFHEEYA